LDVEISKCEKKLLPIRLNLDKVKRVEAPSDCSETVPQNVKRRRQGASYCSSFMANYPPADVLLEAEIYTPESFKEHLQI
jgi:hypothetical protein